MFLCADRAMRRVHPHWRSLARRHPPTGWRRATASWSSGRWNNNGSGDTMLIMRHMFTSVQGGPATGCSCGCGVHLCFTPQRGGQPGCQRGLGWGKQRVGRQRRFCCSGRRPPPNEGGQPRGPGVVEQLEENMEEERTSCRARHALHTHKIYKQQKTRPLFDWTSPITCASSKRPLPHFGCQVLRMETAPVKPNGCSSFLKRSLI